ncbi:MAG: hypothetical protein N4A61_15270 [Pelagimonas sp.]|jgi:hypothetical protein|nr:hypothetical protein [Pelagimonas sp.]
MELPSYAIPTTGVTRPMQSPVASRFRSDTHPPVRKPDLGAPTLPPRPPGFGYGLTLAAAPLQQTFVTQQARATYQAAKDIISSD